MNNEEIKDINEETDNNKNKEEFNGTFHEKDSHDVNDIVKEDVAAYTVSKKNLGTVPSGYYYRITCKHYAKENGVFGSSESISNTSNSVYIS